jgi:hypothetical protein
MLLAILCVALAIQADIRAMRFRAPGTAAERHRKPAEIRFFLFLFVVGAAGIVWEIVHRIH